MKPTLYLIRGLPGSGKSTLAALIADKSPDLEGGLGSVRCVESDQFFVSSNGHKEQFSFDRRFLGAAHDECYARAMRYLRAGFSVTVANTFSTKREIDRYLTGLKRTGLASKVDVQIIQCVGKYKSPHNVPSRAVEKMRERWEPVAGEVTYNGKVE